MKSKSMVIHCQGGGIGYFVFDGADSESLEKYDFGIQVVRS